MCGVRVLTGPAEVPAEDVETSPRRVLAPFMPRPATVRRVDAREQQRRAGEMFGDMGSRLWADRAAAELAAAGGETGCARAASADSLTPQALHVALAVAAGATNREVSGVLFLSPETVEMHLTRVYRKLGLRSRTDLASYFRPPVTGGRNRQAPRASAPRLPARWG